MTKKNNLVFSKNNVFGYAYNPDTLESDILTEIHAGGKIIYLVKEQLGRGKDGSTYFCERSDDKSKWAIKVQSHYGRAFYHRTESVQRIYEKVNLDKEFNDLIRFPEQISTAGKVYEVIGYPCNEPYIKYDPINRKEEWIKALIEIARLNSKLLEHNMAIWDYGFVGIADLKDSKFKSGLNYMKHYESGKTRWVDYGGNAFCTLENTHAFIEWRKHEEKSKFTFATKKPMLGVLNSTMLKWYFLLHIEYHVTQYDDLHTKNLIEGLAAMLQTSNKFTKMVETNESIFESDICKQLINKTENLNWTKPETWNIVQQTLKGIV